jgi:hypothetical protein
LAAILAGGRPSTSSERDGVASAGANERVVRFGTALALIPIAASLFSLPENYRLPKQDFRGAFDYVESQRIAGHDRVVTVGLASLPYELFYAPEWEIAESLAEIKLLRESGAQSWLVYSFPDHLDRKYSGVMDEIRTNFDEMHRFPGTLGDGDIYVWRSKARSDNEKQE